MGHSNSKTELQCSSYTDNNQTFQAHGETVLRYCNVFSCRTYFASAICHVTMFTSAEMIVGDRGWYGGNITSQQKGENDYFIFASTRTPISFNQLALLRDYIDSPSWQGSDEWKQIKASTTKKYELLSKLQQLGIVCWGHALVTYENNFQVTVCVACRQDGKKYYLWVNDEKARVSYDGDNGSAFSLYFPEEKIPGEDNVTIKMTPRDGFKNLRYALIAIFYVLVIMIFSTVKSSETHSLKEKMHLILMRAKKGEIK